MNNHEPNTVPDADQIREELEDRLMNQNLEELLGGVSPNPEERNLAAAPAGTTEAAPTAAPQSKPGRRSWLAPVALLATCACVALVLFSGVFDFRQDSLQMSMSENTQNDIQRISAPLHGVEESIQHSPGESFEMNDTATQHIAGVPVIVSNDSRNLSAAPITEMDYNSLRTDKSPRLKTPTPQNPQSNPGDNSLPSGYYLRDDVQYYPAGPNEQLPELKRALEQYRTQQQATGINERYGRAPVLDAKGRESGAKLLIAEEVRRHRANSSNDRELGFKQGSFNLGKTVDFDFNVQAGDGEAPFSTDGAEGVGPGNRGDNYAPIIENNFLGVVDSPLSTFSIDVDTASYSNMRRMLTQNNMLPPPDAVRIEEMVNYFNYDYPAPEGEDPFSVNVETASCPWRPESRLVRIALKGKEIPFEERPASNLVFLLDVSGSMKPDNKLPLLKSCFKMLVDYLTENDTISIVVYASGTRMVLPPTTGDQKAVIMEALDHLRAGGSTNGAGGIQLAYQTATENFIPGGINRVILATDGDFNVGITSQGDLHRLIEEKARSNVFLTTLGFGFGNLQDNTIELLADKGNGNYAYIDSLAEGRKVLIDEMGSTLNTIAKDVKIQIEFNPLEVAAFRLIGYENRILAHRDFNDDTKDAGEIGAGHTVTAFYEIIPAGEEAQLVDREVDKLEFQRPQKATKLAKEGDMMLVKLRYKQPTEDESRLLNVSVKDSGNQFPEASRDFQFAASVASFGMLLRKSQYAGQANFKNVLEQAQATLGETPESYRVEFVELVKLADRLAGRK